MDAVASSSVASSSSSTASSTASSVSSGAGGAATCTPVPDADPCTADVCVDGETVHEQIVSPPVCGVRRIPTQITTPHTMCSGTAVESEPGAVFLGIIWIDPKNADPTTDDQYHICGPPEFASTPGCSDQFGHSCDSGFVSPTGTCQPGWPCDIVRELPNGDVQYIGGHCD